MESGTDDGPIGPPAVERVDRVQFNSKLRLDLRARFVEFTLVHRSTQQAVLEAALEEYMSVRGFTDQAFRERQQRARRHGGRG